MTIGKLLYTLGIVLIIFGFISGINFYMKFNEFGTDSNFSYSLNTGKIIVGAILVLFGNKLKKKEG
jgi:uncharacterized membrane protein